MAGQRTLHDIRAAFQESIREDEEMNQKGFIVDGLLANRGRMTLPQTFTGEGVSFIDIVPGKGGRSDFSVGLVLPSSPPSRSICAGCSPCLPFAGRRDRTRRMSEAGVSPRHPMP